MSRYGGWNVWTKRLTAACVAAIAGVVGLGPVAQAETFDVKVNLLGRDGKPAADSGDEMFLGGPDGGFAGVHGETLKVPKGSYAAHAVVTTPRPGKHERALTFLVRPAVEVTSDLTITFDARKSKRLSVSMPRRDARVLDLVVGGARGDSGGMSLEVPETHDEVYVGSDGPSAQDYKFFVRARLAASDAALTVVRPERFGVDVWWVRRSTKVDGRLRAKVVDAGRGRPADLERLDIRGKAVLVTPHDEDDLTAFAAAVAAGGGALAIVRVRPGVRPNNPDGLSLPMVYTTRAEADRLPALAARGAIVELAGLRNSPYVYDLTFPSSGRPPAIFAYRVRDRDLAVVDARYIAQWSGPASGYPCGALADGSNSSGCAEIMNPPQRRTEYFTPGSWTLTHNWLAWGQDPEPLGGGYGESKPTLLRAGTRRAITWGGPVYGPGFIPPTSTSGSTGRIGTRVNVSIPLIADGDGHASRPDSDHEGERSATRVYRDGELVGSSTVAGYGEFTVPRGRTRLRLEVDFARTVAWWRTSTRVKAAWTVRSAGDGVLPLQAVRFTPRTDLSGLVRGGGSYRLPVSVQREVGAPPAAVKSLAVQVSYDDGKTWRQAPLTKRGDGWTAAVKHPRTGFVSLRAQATDVDGNTVEQTIIRAYQVKR